MNTNTAPEANTGRIVSKFWPSSLFIFVNTSWCWFSASLLTSSCKSTWEVQTDFFWSNTWRLHDITGTFSLTQSPSSVRESKMEDEVVETSTVCYFSMLASAPNDFLPPLKFLLHTKLKPKSTSLSIFHKHWSPCLDFYTSFLSWLFTFLPVYRNTDE